jgi:uncharacterized membrane protein
MIYLHPAKPQAGGDESFVPHKRRASPLKRARPLLFGSCVGPGGWIVFGLLGVEYQLNDTKLDRTASVGVIRTLHRDGLLSDDAFTAAIAVVRPVSSWFSWARQMLLLLGSTLVLAGVIFFFAYNWAEMGRFFKLALIEGGIIACIVAAHWRGTKQLSGKVLVLSASILVGVLLAVYGQIYQTGADAFELFVGWSVLILGWVLVTQFAALWAVWLVIVNTAMILYWEQVGAPSHSIRFEFLCLAAAGLNGAGLILREIGVRRGLAWLGGEWLRGVLLIAVLVALSIPAIAFIVNMGDSDGIGAAAGLVWIFAAAGGYACYRFELRDMAALAIIVMNACIVLLTFIGKIVFDKARFEDGIVFLVFAVAILTVVTGAVFWLRQTAASMADKTKWPVK